MKIEVKLYASLDKYLPPGAKNNAARIEFNTGVTPSDLIQQLNVPAENCHLLLINGFYIAPSERSSYILHDNDVVAIWPPIAGG